MSTEIPGEAREVRRVVVIDSALLADIPREEIAEATVFAVDGCRDVVDQISSALRSVEQVDVLRVISHGEDGALRFGEEVIDLATLEKRAGQIAKWKESFSAEAQILLYGCRIAESEHGQKFVKQLAAVVGSKVAASTDMTGVGGDVELEFQVGAVTTGLLADVAMYEQAELSLFLLDDGGFSFEDVQVDWDLDIRTRNSTITSWTNNQNGTITVTMRFDLLGMWWYGYKSSDGWVYMYRDGNEVASKFMQTGTNRTFTATFPVTVGTRAISVSPRRGFPTSWSDTAQTVSIQAPFYIGSTAGYTVSVGQTLYAVVSCLGTPTVVHTATGLPQGVSMSANGTILGTPASGTAGSYIVHIQANNGFGSTSYSLSVLVTNEAPTFLTTNPGLISGAVEDTPFTISHAALAAAVDDSDPNGDLCSFRVESVLGGTLAKNGSPVTAGATLIGPGESLVWTPPPGVSGKLDGFTVKAYDQSLYSTATKKVEISVSAVNDPPTLTQFSGPVATGNEDSATTISLAALLATGDEGDVDGMVTAFVVKEVNSGSLRIGASEATATAWNASSNKAITSGLNGYWTPDLNANGPQVAFRAVARDPGGAESTTSVQAVVTVNAVNDFPALTGIAILSGAAGGSPFEISHAVIAYASDEADVDADPISFRIEAVSSGSLDKWTGSAWAAVTPGTTLLSAGEKLRWTPPAGSSGLRNAFTVKAWDGQLASGTAVQVRIDGDRWRMLPWGDAASSGADPAYRYTHAYSFGAGGSFAINGVTFTGIAGANPSVAGRITMTGFGSSVTNDSNLLTDSTRALANDAVSSSATASTLTLSGLIPGGRYVLSLFTVGQDGGARVGTFSSVLGQITVNQNEYGNNQGLRLDYRYVADAAGTVTLQLSVPSGNFFLYGLANREEEAAFGLYGPGGLTYDAAAKSFQVRGKPLQLPFISAGVLHSLVLKSDGTVAAFGSNDYGQSSVPAGLSQVVAVSAGGYHSLALKSNGTVVAWGYDWQSQSTVPAGLSGVVAISAGKAHNLALKADGTVVAWGSNSGGQTAVPADLNGVVAISAGSNHSMALKSDGKVVAWGVGFYNYATPPADLVGVVAISAGEWHSLALKSDGTVVAWGNNGSFQSQVPGGLKGVVAISAGTSHSLALKSDGTIVVWGDRDNYGLGTMPAGLSGVVAIDAGSEHSVALKSDGTVVTFGWCRFGQQYAATPLGPIAAISTGNDHTVALKLDGTVVAWGGNSYGQTSVPAGLAGVIAVQAGDQFSLALKSDRTVVGWGGAIGTFSGDVAMPAGLANVVQISTGREHALALKADGTVVAWGDNYYGQSIVPTGLSGVVAIAAGGMGSLALKSDGTVVYWGSPYAGRGLVPAGLSGVKAIAAGEFFSLALKTDGTVVGWGDSTYASWWQVPAGLTGVVAIEAGFYHCLALKSDGTVVSWGKSSEVSASANGVGVISLAAGYDNSIALKSDGTIVAWGNNHRGQNNPPLAASLPAVGFADQMSTLSPSGLTYTGRGSTVYASSSNPPTVAGEYTVSVTGGGAGNAYTVSENFTIAKVTPRISYSSQVNTIAYGSPLTSSQVGSSGAWAVVGNSFQVVPGRNVFSPPVGTVLPVGTHPLQVTFLPTDSVNFNPAVATGTVTVTKATLAATNINFVAPDSLTYNGTTKPYTASATGVAGFTYSYAGRAGTVYGPSATAPTYAGDYTVTATVNDPNYQGSKSLDFSIARATPTVAVNPVSSLLTFGQSLASATLSGGTANVPGTFSFAYTGTVPTAGTWSYEVVFTPSDTVNYTTASTMVEVTIDPLVIATGAFTISSPASLVYNGSPKWHSATAAGPYGNLTSFVYNYAGVGGTTYGPSETAPTQAGSYKVTAVLLGPNFYGTAAKNFTITKAATTLTWAAPADIAYGTALTATQLNATANVAGTFAYTPAAGTVLGAGARTLEVAFTPTDTTNYQPASLSVPLKVITTSLPIALLDPPSLTYDGTAKAYVVSQNAYVSAGDNHALVLKSDGTVVAWGDNSDGQTTVPAGLSGVVQVSAGYYHSVAVKSDGRIVGWGYNGWNQYSGTNVSLSPLLFRRDLITNAVAAAAGGSMTVVLLADGTVTVLGNSTYTSTLNVPAGLTGVKAIAAGYHHAMALKSDGTVVAWGSNASQNYGQAEVPAGLSNVVAIAAGFTHSLALKSDGTVVAWGNNGQDRATVPAGLNGVVAITAGSMTSYAVKADGTVVGWGYPYYKVVPTNATGVAALSIGQQHAVAIKTDGTVAVWGRISSVDASTFVPSPLTGVGNFSFSSSYAGRAGTTYGPTSSAPTHAGMYTFTVTSTNPNYNATKTVDFTIAKATPTITTPPQASILTAGQALSAALLDGGVASVPGTFSFTTPTLIPPAGTTLQATHFTPTDATNYAGVPGTVAVRSQRTNATVPSILSLPTAAPITFGQQLQASTLSGGSASVPGTFVYSSRLIVPNPGTALQNITFVPDDIASYAPVTMPVSLTVYDSAVSPLNIAPVPPASFAYDGLPKAFPVSRGQLLSSHRFHALIVKNDGTVTAFGDNFLGGCDVPAGLSGVVAVSAGDGISLALKSDGSVVEWGGDAGWGPIFGRPPAGLTGVVAIARTAHGLALKSDGTVVAWGDNTSGKATVPAGLNNVVAIAASEYASFALKSDGSVVSWGGNSFGEQNIPAGLSGVIAIDAGPYSGVVALKADGTVVVWGGGPSAPAGLNGVVAVAAGYNHMTALKADGTVVAWGSDTTFSLSGANTNLVPWNASGVVAIGAGSAKTYALKSDGSVVWWGQGSGSGPYRVDGQVYIAPGGYAVSVPAISSILPANSSGFAFSASYVGREGTSYAASATPPTNPGSYTVTITGTDPDFAGSKTIDFSITKATPAITAAPIATGITFGQALADSTLTGGTASVPGTFGFSTPAHKPNAGTHVQGVVFTPIDTGKYLPVTLTVPITVAKATPVLVALPNATSLQFGQNLGAALLGSGSGSVQGVFSFTSAGATPGLGLSSYEILFTPLDSDNYVHVTSSVDVLVNRAVPSILTPPVASSIAYGQSLADSTLTGGVASVAGSFAWVYGGTTPAAGTSSHEFIFSPEDSTNYATVTGTVNVTVQPTSPTILTVPTATAINYGQTLASSTLTGGVGSVAGSFSWVDAGTAPNAGTTAQSFVFVPEDTTNYVSVNGSVPVEVNQAVATVTLDNLTAEYDGTAKAVSTTTTPLGLTVNLAYNSQSSAPVEAGSYEVLATIDDANYTGSKSMILTIAPKTVTVTAAAKTKEYGVEVDPELTYVVSGLVGSDALTGSLARESGDNAGTYAITLGSLSAGSNYTIAYVGAVFTITAAALPDPAWEVFPPASLEYDGTAKAHLAIAGGAGPSLYSSTVFSYLYEGRDGTSYAATATAPTQVGDYRLTTTASGNYTGTRQTDFTITPKMLTVTGLTAVSRAYDGTTAASLTGTAAYDGLVTGEEFAVLGTPLATFATAQAGTNKVVSVSGLEAPTANYQVTQPSLLADITKATLVPVLSGEKFTEVVFDGNPHAFTASTTPATTVSVTYNGSTTPPIDVGTYLVLATVQDDNYEGSEWAQLQILAKSVTSWAEESGLTGAAAAPTADPDGDGLNNATEFAFGTSPSGAGSSEIYEMLPAEEGTMAVGFLRRVSGAEASYQARAFTDLSAGFSSGTLLTPVRSADQSGVPPGYERVEVQAPTTGDRGFIQVQAEVP